MPTKTQPSAPLQTDQEPSQDYIDQGINAAEAFANKGAKNQPQRGGPLRRHGQQLAGGAKGAVKGAAKGAVKEGAKQAAIEGAKGAAKGLQKGGQIGARLGAAMGPAAPVAAPVLGAVGAGIGAGVGGAAGAAKGGAKGAVKGGLEGAAKAKGKQDAQKKGNKIAQGLTNKGLDAAGGAAGIGSKDVQAARAIARNPLSKEALQGAKQLTKTAISNAAAASTGVPKVVWDKAQDLVSSKKFWRNLILLIVALFLILFSMFDGNGSFDFPSNVDITANDTCVPAQFTGDAFGKTSVCTITVTSTGSAQDLTIIDYILPGTEFVSAGENGTYDPTNKIVTWDAQQQGFQLDPINITVTVTIRITTHQSNYTVWNYADIPTPVGLTAASGGGSSCTATGSPDAEAKWQQVLQMGKQYGPLWITFLNDARSVAQQEDYPLAVIVGQGALESAHGTSNFAKTRFNFFGFDAYTNNPGAAKPYPSALASIQDYVNLIKHGNGGSNKLYLQAYADRSDPVKMVEEIKAGGYATDPAYVQKVTSIPEFKILAGVSLPCN